MMKREQFDEQVMVETQFLGKHLGRVVVTFALGATMEFDASLPGTEKHAEGLLKERLWQEVFGKHAVRIRELEARLAELEKELYEAREFYANDRL